MLISRSGARVFGLLVLLLVGGHSLVPSAEAQDRSVPRFGPLVSPDTVQTGPFDLGRLWSFARPPFDYFSERYQVSTDERGLQHARLGTVRFPGCSGALVSPQGLVLTAARCVRAGTGPDSLHTSSFYAEQQRDELELEGMPVERVMEVRDVTARVESLLTEDAGGEGDSSGTWRQAVEQVRRQLQGEAPDDHTVDVVRESGGMRYVAYYARRYEDVRLVFLPDPEVRVGAKMDDVLTYPQYTWDVAALRIYEDGMPLSTDTHFELRSQGARPGDAVFSVGYPDDTRRVETHHQIGFRRDVEYPDRRERLEAWTTHLKQYVDTAATHSGWAHRLATEQSTLKRVRAQLESLGSSYVTARLQRRDAEVRNESSRASEIMDELEALQTKKRTYAESYRAFSFLLHPSYSSATLRRALRAYGAMNDIPNESSGTRVEAVPAQPPALDAALLADHLEQMQAHVEDDSALVYTLDEFDAAAVVQNSVLSTPDEAQRALQNRQIPDDDPAIRIIASLYDRYAAFKDAWTTLRAQERALTDDLAEIRHRRVDRPVTLPQSRSLRISDGRIQGYPYNGTVAPPFTTFYGLYSRHLSPSSSQEDPLPRRWRTPSSTFDRATPLTTVSTTDLGSGAYGGPLLNASLQLVGIVVDGNVQSAAGDVLFLPRRMRAVSVDVRGVLEGLSSIYGAESLVQEMTRGSVSEQ